MSLPTQRFDSSPATDLGFKESIRRHLFYSQAKSPSLATEHDHYMALALAVRDRLLQNWVDTAETYTTRGVRTAAYLSAEYLLGPHLENNLVNLGIRDEAQQACRQLGLDFHALLACEPEPGLGNGGLTASGLTNKHHVLQFTTLYHFAKGGF
jgi:starch phosphorylase